MPTQLHTLLLYPNLFKTSLFTPSQEVPISFRSFLTISYHFILGRPAFRLALHGWPTRTSFGILKFINHFMLNEFLATGGIEPSFRKFPDAALIQLLQGAGSLCYTKHKLGLPGESRTWTNLLDNSHFSNSTIWGLEGENKKEVFLTYEWVIRS